MHMQGNVVIADSYIVFTLPMRSEFQLLLVTPGLSWQRACGTTTILGPAPTVVQQQRKGKVPGLSLLFSIIRCFICIKLGFFMEKHILIGCAGVEEIQVCAAGDRKLTKLGRCGR